MKKRCIIFILFLILIIVVKMGYEIYNQKFDVKETQNQNEQLQSQTKELEIQNEQLQGQLQDLQNQIGQLQTQEEQLKENCETMQEEYAEYIRFKEEIYLTESCTVQVYNPPLNKQFYLVFVTEQKYHPNYLYCVLENGEASKIVPLEFDNGLQHIYSIEFHEWENEVYVEVAVATHQGNGCIYLYRIKDGTIENLLMAQGTVDRNLDLTTNSIYQNDKLTLIMEEGEDSSGMPIIKLQGIKLIYGYDKPNTYAGQELLYQQNFIEFIYQWDNEEQVYVQTGESSKTIQEVKGVYPIEW